MIYLDYNATTPVASEVVAAMQPFFERHFGNPSSSHAYGQAARDAVEWSRRQVASLIGADPEEIYFTSGGTEASNIAIRGAARAADCRRVVTTAIEHPATLSPSRELEREGLELEIVGVDRDCRIDPADIAERLISSGTLLSVMHANNVTGTIQPIREIAERVRAIGGLFHCDAAQSVGKIPVDVDELGVDLLTIAGHKLYAPKGIGALYVRRGTPVEPVLRGAGHERGLRPGTENVPGIVGLGEACRLAERTLEDLGKHLSVVRDRLWGRLKKGIDGIARNGDPRRTLPNTLNVYFPGISAREVLEHAGKVCASLGSACHDGGESPSPVLVAMGHGAEYARGCMRLSVGRGTGIEDVDEAARLLIEATDARLSGRSA